MKPKKPRSAYMLFLSDQRSVLKIKYPTYKATEIVKKGAENWKKLEDKSKYEKMALDDKERYKTEFEAYRNSSDFDINSLCVKELKQMCRDKKLKVSGKKADIVSRLKQSKSVSVSKGVSKDTPTTVKEQIDGILES